MLLGESPIYSSAGTKLLRVVRRKNCEVCGFEAWNTKPQLLSFF
uniref:Uncharacterized protein n=1 Tax=Nelumbo nucifera TaxID=4432 RepID=A0A822XME4_NELNU|nr:TPA_asm: hypothetical protein HUJ06_024227 [Nelumbo nucifera]